MQPAELGVSDFIQKQSLRWSVKSLLRLPYSITSLTVQE